MKRTLIVVRRATAEPIAIWAGGIPQVSFARVKACIGALNAERALSRLVGPWEVEVEVMVKSRGEGEGRIRQQYR